MVCFLPLCVCWGGADLRGRTELCSAVHMSIIKGNAGSFLAAFLLSFLAC